MVKMTDFPLGTGFKYQAPEIQLNYNYCRFSSMYV